MKAAEDKQIEELTKCFWLPEHLAGNPAETWPKSLQDFAYRLNSDWYSYDPVVVPDTVANLKKYYPEDEVLMQLASFLESALQSDPQIKLHSKTEYSMFKKSTDGALKGLSL